ncbi:hypothetical protein M404DRAFT_539889 [Pisolithus tinctorius Marx 270]|uniref:Uncharacterized protein n=1 Tax=Pisolithus tinctorius Marx 270 TaxID=870435 RepID=A0A0C3PAV7_PISTI|nr:hypothetical protein M404DRAFT_539889 [Pisolithus tinctorius Marx 270]
MSVIRTTIHPTSAVLRVRHLFYCTSDSSAKHAARSASARKSLACRSAIVWFSTLTTAPPQCPVSHHCRNFEKRAARPAPPRKSLACRSTIVWLSILMTAPPQCAVSLCVETSKNVLHVQHPHENHWSTEARLSGFPY